MIAPAAQKGALGLHPYLFHVGSFPVRVYGLMIATGILVATFLVYRTARLRRLPWAEQTFELAFWAVIGGVLGARVWEVLFTWEYYRDEPWKVIAVWEGGISIQGAVLGGMAAALLWARRNRVQPWPLLDIAAPAVVLAQGIGRIGCLFNGDAYGIPIARSILPAWLGVRYAEGTPAWYAHGTAPLVPAEAFEGLGDFAIAAFLVLYRPRRAPEGWRVLAFGLLYSALRFGLEFWRSDSLTGPGGIKAAQMLAVAAALACAGLLWWRIRTALPPVSPAAAPPGHEVGPPG